jgi:LPXTG-motif cell wall-anchored protein
MMRISLVALILIAGTAHGQGGFGGGFGGQPMLPPAPFVPNNPFPPQQFTPAPPPNSAEARREARDQVLRSVGPEALAFTKRYGDLGIAVLQQCSPEAGKKLVAMFNNGQLARLKNPQGALEAIRQNGEPPAAWFCNNIGRLSDPESLELWCRTPMEFVYDLKDLDQSAEELRASRKFMPSWLKTDTGEWNMTAIVIGGLVLLLLGAVFFKRRQPGPAMP